LVGWYNAGNEPSTLKEDFVFSVFVKTIFKRGDLLTASSDDYERRFRYLFIFGGVRI